MVNKFNQNVMLSVALTVVIIIKLTQGGAGGSCHKLSKTFFEIAFDPKLSLFGQLKIY